MENPDTNLVMYQEDAVEMVLSDKKFVYIEEITYIGSIMVDECDLILGKEKFYKANFGFPAPQGFPYMQLFNKR